MLGQNLSDIKSRYDFQPFASLEEERVVDHVSEHGEAVEEAAQLGHDGPLGAAAGRAPHGGGLLVQVLLRRTKA